MYLKESLIVLALAACFCCVVSLPVVTVDIPADGNETTDLQDNSALVNQSLDEDNRPQRRHPDEGIEGTCDENIVPQGGNRRNECRCFQLMGGLELCVMIEYEENESGELVARKRRFVRATKLKRESD